MQMQLGPDCACDSHLHVILNSNAVSALLSKLKSLSICCQSLTVLFAFAAASSAWQSKVSRSGNDEANLHGPIYE